jgi:hypothetical protein
VPKIVGDQSSSGARLHFEHDACALELCLIDSQP